MAENLTRELVKARLRPALYADLKAYAGHNHRSISSAVEHLVAIALHGGTANVPPPVAPDIQYR